MPYDHSDSRSSNLIDSWVHRELSLYDKDLEVALQRTISLRAKQ